MRVLASPGGALFEPADDDFEDFFTADQQQQQQQLNSEAAAAEAAAAAAISGAGGGALLGALGGLQFEERQEERVDREGYFTERPGELLCDGRFRVQHAVGKGVFSTVVVCAVVSAHDRAQLGGEQVAVKIIRGNDVMYKAGLKELSLLKEVRRRRRRWW